MGCGLEGVCSLAFDNNVSLLFCSSLLSSVIVSTAVMLMPSPIIETLARSDLRVKLILSNCSSIEDCQPGSLMRSTVNQSTSVLSSFSFASRASLTTRSSSLVRVRHGFESWSWVPGPSPTGLSSNVVEEFLYEDIEEGRSIGVVEMLFSREDDGGDEWAFVLLRGCWLGSLPFLRRVLAGVLLSAKSPNISLEDMLKLNLT